MGFESFADGTYSAFTLRTFANDDLTPVVRRELVRETYDLKGQLTTMAPILDAGREAANLYGVQATPRGELLVSSGEQRTQRLHLVPPTR